jgi:hypothetical protein
MSTQERKAEWHERVAAEMAHMADNFRADPFWVDMQFGSRMLRIQAYQNAAVQHWQDAQNLRKA